MIDDGVALLVGVLVEQRRRTGAALRAPAAPADRRRDTRASCRSCRRSVSGSAALAMSDLSSGRARSRSTGWPIRATFRIDMKQDYRVHLTRARIRVLPALRRHARIALLKATEPERLVCARCGFVFYLDPKVAVGTIITRRAADASCWCSARSNLATASGCFPAATSIAAKTVRGRRAPRGARGMRPRHPARSPDQHLLVPGRRADHHRLCGHGDRRVPRV